MNYQKTIEQNNSETINNHIIQIINCKSQLFQLIIYANTHQSFLSDPNKALWGKFLPRLRPINFWTPPCQRRRGETVPVHISNGSDSNLKWVRFQRGLTPRGILLSLFMAHIYIRKVSSISNDIHHNTLYHYISYKFKGMVEVIIYRTCVMIDISKLSVRALL